MKVLQTFALPLGHSTGYEKSLSALAEGLLLFVGAATPLSRLRRQLPSRGAFAPRKPPREGRWHGASRDGEVAAPHAPTIGTSQSLCRDGMGAAKGGGEVVAAPQEKRKKRLA